MSKPKNIKSLLSAATAGLLCQTGQADVLKDVDLEATAMQYREEDRITVLEEVIQLRKTLPDADVVELKLSFDSMSGASPTGAAKTSNIQTSTNPSGTTEQTEPGETPTYRFYDNRQAISLGWEQIYHRTVTNISTLHYAQEGDYRSAGISDTLSKEFNNRMTTFSLGFSLNRDTIEAEGGIPIGLAPVTDSRRSESREKELLDVMLGLTHILDRRTLVSLNVGGSRATGYLTDPYKIISYLDDVSGEPKFTGADPYYFEKRPAERNTYSVSLQLLHQFVTDNDSMRINYQYYEDDWGVYSHTVDLKMRHRFGNDHFMEYHVRGYKQTAADFYHYFLIDGPYENVESRDITTDPGSLDYASADHRLGALATRTVGVTYGYPLQHGDGKIAPRVEYIQQTDSTSRFDSVKAWVFQLILSLRF